VVASDDKYQRARRAALLRRLSGINNSEERHGVPPRFTVDDAEAAELPLDQLRTMVAAEADHLEEVARALKGTR
jgi:hypothetical protein